MVDLRPFSMAAEGGPSSSSSLASSSGHGHSHHHHQHFHPSPSAYGRQQVPQRQEQQEEQQPQQPTLDSVWKACAYGDLEAVQSFCEEDKSLVNRQDGGGYSALQWAALNNRPAVASYLIDQGAALNAQVIVANSAVCHLFNTLDVASAALQPFLKLLFRQKSST